MSRSRPEWIGKSDDHWPPPRSVRERVKSRTDNCCAACGIRVRYGGEIDHAEPLAFSTKERPLNRESNLRLLCKNCHGAKTATEKAVVERIKRKADKLGPLKREKSKRSFWKPEGAQYNWRTGRYEIIRD